jgi:hypothetical protein
MTHNSPESTLNTQPDEKGPYTQNPPQARKPSRTNPKLNTPSEISKDDQESRVPENKTITRGPANHRVYLERPVQYNKDDQPSQQNPMICEYPKMTGATPERRE